MEQYLATEQARFATRSPGRRRRQLPELAADRESLHLAQATFDSQQASYKMVRRFRELGVASDLDLQQAESQVEAARVDIPRYAGQGPWTKTRSTPRSGAGAGQPAA